MQHFDMNKYQNVVTHLNAIWTLKTYNKWIYMMAISSCDAIPYSSHYTIIDI